MAHPLKQKNVPYNRKTEINQYLKNFKIPFEMKDDAIDLRTMADNYDTGILPLEDIFQALLTVLGPNFKPQAFDYDPSEGVEITWGNGTTINPKFTYINWDEAYLWPIFQRDIAPNHTSKIYSDFNPTCVIVPCAIKFTIKGKVYYCIWDGHHTIQVCRLKGYNRFPVWFIDTDVIADDIIIKAGFDPKTERIEYGCWLAGHNMIRINSRNKRKLHAYDEFMVLLETKDTATVQMNNVLTATGFTPKRNANTPNAFSQIKSGQAIFEMTDDYGVKGKYFKRALQFHNAHWKKAAAELETWRPMALLYKMAEVEGFAIDAAFDDELGKLFIKIWGDPTSVQLGLKDNYETALHTKGFTNPRDHDQWRVYDAIVNLYNDEIGRIQLPTAQCRW